MKIEKQEIKILADRMTSTTVDTEVFENTAEAVEFLGEEKALKYLNYVQALVKKAQARKILMRTTNSVH